MKCRCLRFVHIDICMHGRAHYCYLFTNIGYTYILNEFKDKNNKESANKLMKLQKYSSAKN